MKKSLLFSLLLFSCVLATWTQEITYRQVDDVPYVTTTDAYRQERCRLDVYYPEGLSDCPVVVWFHGGGLTTGHKSVPAQLKEQGLVVVAVEYRLLPQVSIDACLDDAAAAVAWAFREVSAYGGSPSKLFVAGHSAGGYLTSMIGLDKSWLQAYGLDPDSIRALVPFSPQVISHFAYRKMQGIDSLQPTIDRYAPLYHIRPDCPPYILVTGDREHELYGRYEECAYMWRMMKLVGHQETFIYEIQGYGHTRMRIPAFHILLQWVAQLTGGIAKF